MALPVVGLAALVAVKLASVGYVAHIASSPLGGNQRTSLLDHVEEVIAKLKELGQGPNEDKEKTLRDDIARLRSKVDGGWAETADFGAAQRLTTYIAWAHTKSTASGMLTVADNMRKSAMGFLFGEEPPKPPEQLS